MGRGSEGRIVCRASLPPLAAERAERFAGADLEEEMDRARLQRVQAVGEAHGLAQMARPVGGIGRFLVLEPVPVTLEMSGIFGGLSFFSPTFFTKASSSGSTRRTLFILASNRAGARGVREDGRREKTQPAEDTDRLQRHRHVDERPGSNQARRTGAGTFGKPCASPTA